VGTGVLAPGIKQLVSEAAHSPRSSVKVKYVQQLRQFAAVSNLKIRNISFRKKYIHKYTVKYFEDLFEMWAFLL
jgi:hypothetical protein